MAQVTTITEIAKRCGVSHPAVSAILNGKWRQQRISEATCLRVQAMAKELNYRPNRLVKSLKSGRTNSLALVMPTIQHAYFPRIAMGVEHEAKQHGYHVVLSHVRAGEDLAAELEALLERRVDGLIIVPHFQFELRGKYRQLLAEKTKLVFINDYFADVPCTSVIGDDWTGMYKATEHLINLGHQRIAHLAGNFGPTIVQNRVDGYRAAMRAHGLQSPEEYVQGYKLKSWDSSYKDMQTLLALDEPPTAVVAWNDGAALQGMKAVCDAGLRVPDDMAFVGYGDDLEDVWMHRVQLTTIRVDAQEIGKRAMQQLVKEMTEPAVKKVIDMVTPELIVRESCGAGSRVELAG